MKKNALQRRRTRLQKKIAKKLRAPRGFFFTVSKRCYDGFMEAASIQLRVSKTKEVIGCVELCHYDGNQYATHSDLDSEYWNKGLGSLMYAKAIAWGLKNKLRVRSSGCGSDMALRVWNGKFLRNFFKVRKDKYNAHHTSYKYK